MNEQLEGIGNLFQGEHLVAAVRYRLRWSRPDAQGRRGLEGVLRAGSAGSRGVPPGRFVMHTDEGLTLGLEVTGPALGGWIPFRRIDCAQADPSACPE